MELCYINFTKIFTYVDEIMKKSYEPLGNIIHEVKIRNTGNIQTAFLTEISPIEKMESILKMKVIDLKKQDGTPHYLVGLRLSH